MPPQTQQPSGYYRDGYRGYLFLMFFLVLSITIMVMLNASDNVAAIIACLVCLLMLGVRLAYAQYLWRQTQRARLELPPPDLNSNDSYYNWQNNNLPGHSRLPVDERVFREYTIAVEEERQRQHVFTISRHDPPPDYDSVTKAQRPPRPSGTVRMDESPGVHRSNSNNQLSRSRQGAASRSGSNTSSPNSLSREPVLTQEGGRISENADFFGARIGVQGGDDNQPPPSYDEALAARIYQQLGLEDR